MTEYTRRQLRGAVKWALECVLADGRDIPGRLEPITRAALAQLNSEREPDLREPCVARFAVQPGLHLTVDASHNIILEVRTPDESELLAAVALSDVRAFADLMANARSIVRIADEQGPEVARAVAKDWPCSVQDEAQGVPERGCCGKPGADCTGPCGASCAERGPASEAELALLAELSAAVDGTSAAGMEAFIAAELSQHGAAGIEFAGPDEDRACPYPELYDED